MSNTYTAYIPASYHFGDRVRIGNAIIKHIQKRSAAKKGIGGRRFKNYEDNYVKTVEFGSHNKSKTAPNVTLTGKMLSDMVIVDASLAGRVVVGFRNTLSSEKSVWMREKGYDFLGLSNSELIGILAGFTPPDQQQVIDTDLAEQLIAAINDGN